MVVGFEWCVCVCVLMDSVGVFVSLDVIVCVSMHFFLFVRVCVCVCDLENLMCFNLHCMQPECLEVLIFCAYSFFSSLV